MNKALWAKGSSVNKAMQEFTVGNDPEIDLNFIKFDIIGSLAHAKMLNKIDILNNDELEKITTELKKLLEVVKNEDYKIDRSFEDCHTAIEHELTQKIGDIGKKIHTGRSRNDQVLLAIRLYLRENISNVLTLLVDFNTSLLNKITELGDVPLPGYTHMQKAMPSSLGMWLHSFAEWALELINEGTLLLDSINTSPLGAASGFGVPLNLDREYVAKLLGFKGSQRSVIHVQNSRGRYELKALRYLEDCFHLIEKFSIDFILYNTQEFGFLNLPKSLTTGSSIMPQKHNPDILELLRGNAAKVRGSANELQWVIAKLPSNYHRDFQYSKEPVVRAFNSTLQSLPMLITVTDSLTVNEEKLKNSMTDDLYATYDTYMRVRNGTPFREAYKETANLISEDKLDVSQLKKDFKIIEEKAKLEIKECREEFLIINKKFVELGNLFSKCVKNLIDS
ncbi:UNVERIFIED_CONTAM: hypothetical protein GTU68_027009 [Idotea baltica]|nr:hypothetical protein [Idotea baltica]